MVVPPGQQATIGAEMDTRNFVGKKATVLYVTLVNAKGTEAEVGLGVSSTILSDIVLNPGTIDFGVIKRGQTVERTLTIERLGMPDWQVQRMISGCKAIDATLTETVRQAEHVGYLLKVSVRPDAAAGVVRDEIRLLTNDRETPAFPVQVTAKIQGDLSSSPTILSLGKSSSSEQLQGRFLVRASRPFKILQVENEGDGFRVKLDDTSARPIHLISVSYLPDEGRSRGDVRHIFRLQTDLAGEPPLALTTTVHVEP
ncbi:MAG: hypothetical protein NVSMB9_15150 [Isosphaeraceae bacterium]